jgi:hypothetical protein
VRIRDIRSLLDCVRVVRGAIADSAVTPDIPRRVSWIDGDYLLSRFGRCLIVGRAYLDEFIRSRCNDSAVLTLVAAIERDTRKGH